MKSLSPEGRQVLSAMMHIMGADRAVYYACGNNQQALVPIGTVGLVWQSTPHGMPATAPVSLPVGQQGPPTHPVSALWRNSGQVELHVDDISNAPHFTDNLQGKDAGALPNRAMYCLKLRDANGKPAGVLQFSMIDRHARFTRLAELRKHKIEQDHSWLERLKERGGALGAAAHLRSVRADESVNISQAAGKDYPFTHTQKELVRFVNAQWGQYLTQPELRAEPMPLDRQQAIMREMAELMNQGLSERRSGDEESFSEETLGHSSRVSTTFRKFCSTVAERLDLQLGNGEKNWLHVIGKLHDLGKHSISGDTLNFKDRLDPLQRYELSLHAVHSRGSLKLPGLDPRIAQIAGAHHMGVDDFNGYPIDGGLLVPYRVPRHQGKRKNPMEAQIMAVCDVFDALAVPRGYQITAAEAGRNPYKTLDRILDIMVEDVKAGKLDKALVSLFFKESMSISGAEGKLYDTYSTLNPHIEHTLTQTQEKLKFSSKLIQLVKQGDLMPLDKAREEIRHRQNECCFIGKHGTAAYMAAHHSDRGAREDKAPRTH